MKLSEAEILNIVSAEESAAIDYEGEIALNRATLLDYYNSQPFGDEVEGQSQAVTSDVFDVVEGMLPSLMRTFTQGKYIATINGQATGDEEEARQKQEYCNHVFMRENQGTLILYNMMKDALLQYSGTVKVYQEEVEKTTERSFPGLTDLELQRLQLEAGIKIESITQSVNEFGEELNSFDVVTTEQEKTRQIKIDNIPPEEFVFNKSSRDFVDPVFCGHRTPKTRSGILGMGFDADIVNSLPADNPFNDTHVKNARQHDIGMSGDNPGNHHPNDLIYLGEYYIYLDMNGDGSTQLYQVFKAGNALLSKERVKQHPFATIVPIPIPHRAIGTCPAEQAADLQFRKSVLTRQMLDNIYATNHNRVIANERVNFDDLNDVAPGDVVRIDDKLPIGDAIKPLVVQPIISELLAAIEHTNTEREVRTGVTRYNQGMDTDSLNKTATGFKGIRDMSQMRVELIARIFADTGIRDIFRKILDLAKDYQKEATEIRTTNEVIKINPQEWSDNTDITIDAGIGAGDRQEKIESLNYIAQLQREMVAGQSLLADEGKIYNTLAKLVNEIGLKEPGDYFNNPAKPDELLQAENEQLTQAATMMRQHIEGQGNDLAEAAQVQAQADLMQAQATQNLNIAKLQEEQRQFNLELVAKQEKSMEELAQKYIELELKYETDVKGQGQ
jgi:hypothetical protein